MSGCCPLFILSHTRDLVLHLTDMLPRTIFIVLIRLVRRQLIVNLVGIQNTFAGIRQLTHLLRIILQSFHLNELGDRGYLKFSGKCTIGERLNFLDG